MTKYLFTVCFSLYLIACASTQNTMNTWIGHSKRDLILQFGPPSKTADDGANGEIIVYAKQVYIPSMHFSGVATPDANGGISTSPGTNTPSQNYWQYTMYFINPEGKIYHWLIQKEQVPPTQIDLKVYKQY